MSDRFAVDSLETVLFLHNLFLQVLRVTRSSGKFATEIEKLS